MPLAEALRDWRTDPRWVRPDDPPVDVLCGELRSAGMSAGQAGLLGKAARRAGRWWPGAGGLPAQIIHGDLAPGNVLADPGTGEVTGLLDFELAGAGFGVQDILAALYNSTALGAPDWPRRTAAFLRGCASVRRLEPAEVAALPELLIARSLGSVLWRAARWRAGPRALRRGHSPGRETGGDHAVARGKRGCVPVRRDRRERGFLTLRAAAAPEDHLAVGRHPAAGAALLIACT